MTRGTLLPAVLGIATAAACTAFSPTLPTDNDALFRGRPADFYTFTDRDFEGVKSQPWEGGTYGFSRGPQRIGDRVVLTKLHEGVDISPVRRDAAGEPLDEVRAIEAGRVVHVAANPRDSNYGRYVVVQHEVGGSPVYSIYAHLAGIRVRNGQKLTRGQTLGRLGYSGAGIDRRRAHLHLEIAILWSDAYQGWHDLHFTLPNKHGIYNGMNLMGLDAADFYLRQRANPALTLPAYIAGLEPAFRVCIPATPSLQLPSRYPWLIRGTADTATSWTIAFTGAGFPISLTPGREHLAEPRVEWVGTTAIPCDKASRSLIEGPHNQPRLADNGRKLLQLLTFPSPEATP